MIAISLYLSLWCRSCSVGVWIHASPLSVGSHGLTAASDRLFAKIKFIFYMRSDQDNFI